MMTQVAIIKDVFRNTPHVILFKTDDAISTKALTEYGKNILKDIVLSSDTDMIALPDGFSCTKFKDSRLSDGIEQKNNDNAIKVKSLEAENISIKTKSSANVFVHRNLQFKNDSAKRFSDMKINNLLNAESKLNAINFKARQFQVSSKISTVILPMKTGYFGFDRNSFQFSARKENPLSVFAAEKAEQYVGKGIMRRFTNLETNSLQKSASRRANRRAKSIANMQDTEIKGTIKYKLLSAIKSRLK